MEQFLQQYKELKSMVKMSTFFKNKQQAPAKLSVKSKKIKEVAVSREELVQKLHSKVQSLKDARTTKKEYKKQK